MPVRRPRYADAFVRGMRRLFVPSRRVPEDQAWFYHPEMQARIAEAEADFREERSVQGSSLEELLAHLDSFKREAPE